MLGFFRLVRFSQRSHGEPEAERNRDGQHQVNQDLQEQDEFHQPYAACAREEHIRQKPVADNNDQDDADDGLDNFRPRQVGIAEDEVADDKSDGSRGELRKERKSERGAPAGTKQARLHELLKSLNVLLKFTAQKLAAFRV